MHEVTRLCRSCYESVPNKLPICSDEVTFLFRLSVGNADRYKSSDRLKYNYKYRDSTPLYIIYRIEKLGLKYYISNIKSPLKVLKTKRFDTLIGTKP